MIKAFITQTYLGWLSGVNLVSSGWSRLGCMAGLGESWGDGAVAFLAVLPCGAQGPGRWHRTLTSQVVSRKQVGNMFWG